MVNGIIGKKVGMTQLFLEDGTLAARHRSPGRPLHRGAVEVGADGRLRRGAGLGLVEARPIRNANKALTGHHKKANVPATRVQREVKIAKGAEAPKPGDQVLVSIFSQGERVDVIGISKGHGFQGVVKRHHFRGGQGTHGSMFHCAPGSIGASRFPSRVLPGMWAHGHMGIDRVTVRNLEVLEVDSEDHLIVVKGAVPGANGGYVVVRRAVEVGMGMRQIFNCSLTVTARFDSSGARSLLGV